MLGNLLIVASRHTSLQTLTATVSQHVNDSLKLHPTDKLIIVDNMSPHKLVQKANVTYRQHGIHYIENTNWTIRNGWEFGAWRWALTRMGNDVFMFQNIILLQDSVHMKHTLPRSKLSRPTCISFSGWKPECNTNLCYHVGDNTKTCLHLAKRHVDKLGFRVGAPFLGCTGPNMAASVDFVMEMLQNGLMDVPIATKRDEQCSERLLGWYIGEHRTNEFSSYFFKTYLHRT